MTSRFPLLLFSIGLLPPLLDLSAQEASPSLAISPSGGATIEKGESVTLSVEPIAGATEIRWYQIIPDISKYYKNANHPWEKDPYQWVGFGKIDYERREIGKARGAWELSLFGDETTESDKERLPLAPTRFAPHFRRDVGSFWFQVEVEVGGKTRRSAGLEDNTERGLSPKVFRLTVREDDSYLGALTGFFNVPGLFGSIPYQCNHYIGVDCADVLVTARGEWRGVPNTKEYNVSMLVSGWPRVTEFEISNGEPSRKLAWGKDLRRGDILAVRYEGRSRYQHIGALWGDSDEDGLLSPADHVIHAGPEALHTKSLRAGSFDGHIVVLRAER